MRFIRTLILFMLLVLLVGGCGKEPSVDDVEEVTREEPVRFVRVLLAGKAIGGTVSLIGDFSIEADCAIVEGRFTGYGDYRVEAAGGRVQLGGWSVDANSVRVVPGEGRFGFDGAEYRGELEFFVGADGNSLDVVNVLPVEDYLAGVVGLEMPPYWEMEALKAQAISARTYCLFIKERFGAGRSWDVRRTQANQAYGGVSVETARIWQVIEATRGDVLVSESGEGERGIFPTYYSSMCGGHTEDSWNVFGGLKWESLGGAECEWCERYGKKEFFFWGEVEMSKDEVNAKLLERYPLLVRLGRIVGIEAMRVSVYDGYERITMVKLVGDNGEIDTVRAEDLRLTLDSSGLKLKSCVCRIEDTGLGWRFVGGRGFGHGVGLCQYGAEGMAREGRSAEAILRHYYPECEIVKIDE